MKKILVPTDFSDQALNAIKAAIILAKKTQAEIILLHILDLPQQGSDLINVGSKVPEVLFFKNSAENKLKELAQDPMFEGITINTSLILEKTSLGVIKAAQTNNCDLIVIGSHGTSGVKDYFVGSNTERVVRHSPIPVLVIKGKTIDFNITHFIFASDFSDGMKKPFLQALKFSKIIDATFTLLMVNTPNNFKPTYVAEEILEDFLTDISQDDYNLEIYNDLNIESGIANFAKKVDADLIGIATHGRTGISHFFNGSISEDLVNTSKCSVITFRVEI
ncbi:universal stress protein [Myroides sp. LJL119]